MFRFKTSLKEAWQQLNRGAVIIVKGGSFFTVLQKTTDGRLAISYSNTISSVASQAGPFEYVEASDSILGVDGEPFEEIERALRNKHELYLENQDGLAAAEFYDQRRATAAIPTDEFQVILERNRAVAIRISEIFHDREIDDWTAQARLVLQQIFGDEAEISDDKVALMTTVLSLASRTGRPNIELTFVDASGLAQQFFRGRFAH